MKKHLRILSAIILTFGIITSCCMLSANAAIPPQPYGDVDSDQSISILDATAVQLYVAQKGDIHYGSLEAADVDGDSKISILDATIIQQYVAGIITEFPVGDEYFIDKYLHDVFADYDSGKAMAGFPVTFRAKGHCEPSPTSVKLYVNDELVAQTSQRAEDGWYYLSHTFEQAGTYQIRVFMCDKWGHGLSWSFDDYVVVDKPVDTSMPVITSITRDSTTSIEPEITAVAQFGTAPYQYKFTFEVFNIVEKEQDFSEDNTFDVTLEQTGHPIGGYTVTVTVKDANGNTATESYNFERSELTPA